MAEPTDEEIETMMTFAGERATSLITAAVEAMKHGYRVGSARASRSETVSPDVVDRCLAWLRSHGIERADGDILVGSDRRMAEALAHALFSLNGSKATSGTDEPRRCADCNKAVTTGLGDEKKAEVRCVDCMDRLSREARPIYIRDPKGTGMLARIGEQKAMPPLTLDDAHPTTTGGISGPMDAIQILTRDRDVWKQRAAQAELHIAHQVTEPPRAHVETVLAEALREVRDDKDDCVSCGWAMGCDPTCVIQRALDVYEAEKTSPDSPPLTSNRLLDSVEHTPKGAFAPSVDYRKGWEDGLDRATCELCVRKLFEAENIIELIPRTPTPWSGEAPIKTSCTFYSEDDEGNHGGICGATATHYSCALPGPDGKMNACEEHKCRCRPPTLTLDLSRKTEIFWRVKKDDRYWGPLGWAPKGLIFYLLGPARALAKEKGAKVMRCRVKPKRKK